MESVKRAVLLLKSPYGRNGGILKLQSVGEGVSVYLRTDGVYENASLYLFLSGGREAYAGTVSRAELSAVLGGLPFESIKGAAVVSPDNSFILKSGGLDWQRAAERFRLKRTNAPRQAFAEPARNGEYREKTRDKPAPPAAGENSAAGPQAPCEAPEPLPDSPETTVSCAESPAESAKGAEDGGCPRCPHAAKQEPFDPFPGAFPGSEWMKVSYPGPSGWWHYITGSIYKNGALFAKAVGVPGEYGAAPPALLEGFDTYLRCMSGDAKGYWLMFSDPETSEVLDMGRFRHGA